MLINIEETDFELLIKDVCNADTYHFDKSEFTLAQMEVFHGLANRQ